MKDIKGILFDKDGTLLDVNLLWVPVAYAISNKIMEKYGIDKDMGRQILKAIGIKNGVIESNSVMASGTAGDISAEIEKLLTKNGIGAGNAAELELTIKGVINRAIIENTPLIKPLGNLSNLFDRIKGAGLFIGLATADIYESTLTCLRQLEIEKYFDYIGADDGLVKPKPDPGLLNNFCSACGLRPCEAVVIGDSQRDIQMGINGGAATVAVVPDKNADKEVYSEADYIVGSIEDIFDGSGEFIWNLY